MSLAIFALSIAVGSGPLRAKPTDQVEHMSIEFNGIKSGESMWEVMPDGTFHGKSTITIGTIKLLDEFAGKASAGGVTEFTSTSANPSATVKISYSNGKLTVMPEGQKQTELNYDLAASKATVVGNLIPQSWSEVFKRVDFEKKSKQPVPIFIAETAGAVTIDVTPHGTKQVAKGRSKLFSIAIGGLRGEMAVSDSGSVVGFDVPSQKLRWIADGWEGVYTDPFAKFPELSQATFGIKHVDGQSMKTRDGVRLTQDVLLPDAPGRYPTILLRTPYGRANDAVASTWFVSHGYAVVCQDCRGRGSSDGAWDPFVNERKDGYDAIDWVSHQDWSDGNVGMIGGSYGGFVQWSAAVERHPALKCIIPQVSPPDAMHNLPYENGTIMLYSSLWWARIVEGKDAKLDTIKQSLPHPDGLLALPLTKVDDEAMGRNIPFFDLWLHRYRKQDWKGFDFTDDIAKVKIPVLHVSGWWDGDGIGTKMNFAALRAAKKTNQWLIYGPWVHAFNTNKSFGGVEYGDGAIIDLDTVFLRFFDTFLKHKSVKWDEQPKVRAFFTGTNKWQNLGDWPDPKKSRTTKLYFSAARGALAPKHVGTLGANPASATGKTVFVYDPAKEVVPKELANMDEAKASTIVKLDDHSREQLFFQTTPYAKMTNIAGPVSVNLSFSTRARDTDLFAFIVDVDPKGTIRFIGMPGKIRASYIESSTKPAAITPNKIYTASLPLWDTAHSYLPGHRMGVVIMSSMFPMYARNLGLAEPPARAKRMIKQVNTIYHDATHPSYIEFQTYDKG